MISTVAICLLLLCGVKGLTTEEKHATPLDVIIKPRSPEGTERPVPMDETANPVPLAEAATTKEPVPYQMLYNETNPEVSEREATMPVKVAKSIDERDCCGGTYTDMKSGIIRSPNYPSYYPSHTDCRWNITVPVGCRIRLKCDYFYVGNSYLCSMNNKYNGYYHHYGIDDYVAVYKDGNRNYYYYYERNVFCGHGSSELKTTGIVSNANKMLVDFHSNCEYETRGFDCYWECEGCKECPDACGFENPCESAPILPNANNKRMVGGVEVKPRHRYPWAALLYIYRNEGIYTCGASIIGKNWLLTAAHCVEGTTYKVMVYAGEHSRRVHEKGLQVRYATTAKKEIITYPSYGSQPFPYKLNYDIALIKLSKPLEFTDTVARVCLAPYPYYHWYNNYDLQTMSFTSVGWGRDDTSYISYVAREVNLDGMYYYYCRKHYGTWLHSNIMCTYSDPSPKGTCAGDSGGPLTHLYEGKHYQLGISIFGTGNCTDSAPDGHLFLPYFRYWIRSITGI